MWVFFFFISHASRPSCLSLSCLSCFPRKVKVWNSIKILLSDEDIPPSSPSQYLVISHTEEILSLGTVLICTKSSVAPSFCGIYQLCILQVPQAMHWKQSGSVGPWSLSSFLWYQNTPDLQSFWWFYSLEAGGNIIHPAQTGNWSTRQLKWFSWRKEVCDCSIRNWIHFFLIPVWSPSPDNPSYAKCSRIRSVIRQRDVCTNDALVTQAWALHSETLEQKADLWNLQQRNEAIGKKTGLNTLWVQHESGQDPALENITQYDFEQRLLMRPRVNWEDRVCVQESRPRAIYT